MALVGVPLQVIDHGSSPEPGARWVKRCGSGAHVVEQGAEAYQPATLGNQQQEVHR
ncbi:hypothetical protein HaLaN_21959, partial [Haematococcus lacustris]